MPVEVTTSIGQIGQNLDGNFAVTTPAHPTGGWVDAKGTGAKEQLAAYVLAAVAFATGKQLRIEYSEYSTQFPNYRNVTKVELA